MYFVIDEKPVVECSFITEFEDHIFVSVDAEAFLFLHDLISSYIKEKDRLVRAIIPLFIKTDEFVRDTHAENT